MRLKIRKDVTTLNRWTIENLIKEFAVLFKSNRFFMARLGMFPIFLILVVNRYTSF